LEGVPLPATRDDLVIYARRNGDWNAARILKSLLPGRYDWLDQVGEALEPVQPKWPLESGARRINRPPGSAEALARRVAARLGEVRLSRRTLAAAGGMFVLGLADAACLVSALLAIGATPPWNELLLAYCGAQLVSFLPLTPGGLGVVEGSLAVTLVGTGGSARHVLAAVLLYRAISYWATLPSGAFGYLALRRSAALRRRLVTAVG
jgi:hypothetical protein